ncbi:glycosyltransferase [Flavobacterium caseinilyticum]|uniref:Glycosyltransferase n=1 Tax=Flavobacterium caseinilyticum TaxID=2541732 RepID=A0A4R5AW28_9FLAO|nr:glycosyltransferase [Flavobacterium caseinilyticum]TDD77013.1 glycosyltransferase [Flavobacterium caseinilyticum]
MKVLIDNSNLFAGGGLQVSFSFLRDLRRLQLAWEWHIVQSVKCAENFDESTFPSNFTFYNLRKAEEISKRKRISSVKYLENNIQPDCIFTLFGPSYHKSKFPKIVGFALPYILYPDSPFFKQIGFKEKIYYKLLSILKTYSFKKYSDTLIFETEDAKTIFTNKANYTKDSFVVGNTLNEIFFAKEKFIELKITDSTSLNILFLTANYAHKNMQILPAVIKVLRNKKHLKDFKFLITLDKAELNFPISCDENIIYLGKVGLEKIPALYSNSDMVFIPTLLEVFSATYLEAMFMKKPIVASDLGFSREICGDAALFCNPTNAEAYANAIFEIFHNEKLRKELIGKGTENLKRFGTSMDRTNAYISIIKNIITKNENTK